MNPRAAKPASRTVQGILAATLLSANLFSTTGADAQVNPALLRRVLHREQAALDAYLAGTDGEVRVAISLTVTAGESVQTSSVEVLQAPADHAALSACVEAVLVRLRFPGDGVGSLVVTAVLEGGHGALHLRRSPPAPAASS